MRFHVGPLRYQLRVASEPIITNGRERAGLCIEQDSEIQVSPKVKSANRLHVLCHELMHSWIWASGEPRDVEGWCDLAASMAASALRDLCQQGGDMALQRLLPGESPEPAANRMAMTNTRYCARCQRTIPAGEVQCAADAPGLVALAIRCPHCAVIQRWKEVAAMNGYPSGVPAGDVEFEAECVGSERRIVYD